MAEPQPVTYVTLAAAAALAVLATAFVAAQSLLDMERRLFGALIGVGCHAFRFELRAGIQMQHAIGAETETVAAHGGVSRITTAKILGRRLGYAIGDALLQRAADVDVLSGNTQRHRSASHRRVRDAPTGSVNRHRHLNCDLPGGSMSPAGGLVFCITRR